MQIYKRYVGSTFIKHFFNILLVVVTVFWLTQSIKLIELIAMKGISIAEFLQVTLLLLPPMLYIAIPIAVFISTLVLFNILYNDRELTILFNSGLSKASIIAPILKVTALITILHYIISFYLLPHSYREFKDLQNYFKNQFVSLLLVEKVFNVQSNDLTVYIDHRINNNLFDGIFIYNRHDPDKPVTIIAKSGYILNTENGPEFLLYKGSHQEENKITHTTSTGSFDEYRFHVASKVEPFAQRIYDVNEMYINELFAKLENGKFDIERVVNAAQRSVWPLYSLGFVLCAASFMLGTYNRKGLGGKNFQAAIVGIVFISLSLFANSLASQNFKSILLIFANLILLATFSIFNLSVGTMLLERLFKKFSS